MDSTPHHYHDYDEIMEDEIGETRGTFGEEKCIRVLASARAGKAKSNSRSG